MGHAHEGDQRPEDREDDIVQRIPDPMLDGDPDDEQAVLRLLAIKRRSVDKGLIVIADRFERLQSYLLPLDDRQRQMIMATWPGPVTWLLPVHDQVPGWLRGIHSTLAVRVTAHPLAAELCRQWGKPLVSTSANLAGHPPARSAIQVRRQLGDLTDGVLAGDVDLMARPSEIRDLATGRIIRAG